MRRDKSRRVNPRKNTFANSAARYAMTLAPARRALAVLLVGFAFACARRPNETHLVAVGASSAPSSSSPGLPPETLPMTNPVALSSTASDSRFFRTARPLVARYFELLPHEATLAGDHSHDSEWPNWSEEGDEHERGLIHSAQKSLDEIDPRLLSEQNRIDFGILRNRLAFWLYELDVLREREMDPVAYTRVLGEGIDALVTRDFAPISQRMRSLSARLSRLPALVATAKKRLASPPRIHTETAIEQNKGLISLCRNGLIVPLAMVSPAERVEVLAAAKVAEAALVDFQLFLEKKLMPRSTGDFRLGAAKFATKLGYVLDDKVVPEDIVRGAKILLAETQDAMVATALEIWPGVMKERPPALKTPAAKRLLVKQVLSKLSIDRSTNATIVADATQLLLDTTKFVRANDIVRVPEEPCRVIEMPEYRRGVAIAYCDSSGPLEERQETFYAISPTPKDWSQARAESFYREYNKSMLADLTIHEAMPGHYLQAMHANLFKSDVRTIFSNGAFVEGWAVYAELVMAKHGYGGPKVRIQQQKMALRLAANAILDHEVHAGTMDEKSALALMMDEAFQEEGEAIAKWKRARLTSAQLTTYYFGLSEMMKLRATAESEPAFNERAYHDKLLGFGAPPFRALRELMTASH
jgi:uncharacterized protein (DUF885 family)